jgi:peptidoglycan/xylan/chitin deacetylase (PgdA/CDA1 family)
MKPFQTLALIVSLTIVTVACSNAQTERESEKITGGKTKSVMPSPSVQATSNPEPAENAPAPVAIKYKMKANYDIVPINPEKDTNKVVLLTFDDGPKELAMIDSMLQTLKKYNAKAIFFVNGYRVKAQPGLLTKLHDAGQTIGNHSYDHIALGKENATVIEQQITSVQSQIKSLIGETPRFFRPPFASSNEDVRRICREQDLLFMTWSNGSLDWDSQNQSPESVVKNVMEQLHPGSNILMHELQWTVDGLDKLLSELSKAGYTFVDPKELASEPI